MPVPSAAVLIVGTAIAFSLALMPLEANSHPDAPGDLSTLRLPQGQAASDRKALVALYSATAGPNWTNNHNWLTSAPIGEWYGVTAAGDRVTELNLRKNGLTGAVPPELGNLASLTDFVFFGNNLRGAIPPELGNLAKLTRLALGRNSLHGNIPPELDNLTNLTRLRLANPRLSGCIPPSMRRIEDSDLHQLGLPYCQPPMRPPAPSPDATTTPTLRHTPIATPQSTPTPRPRVPMGKPIVNFHALQTDVKTDEPVSLTLSVVDPIDMPEMTLQLVLQVPSGMSVSGDIIGEHCSIQWSATYKVPLGENRDFILEVTASQPGSFDVQGRMEWYFGDDLSTHDGKTETLRLSAETPSLGEPDVNLHATQTRVKLGEPVFLTLAVDNSLGRP